LGQVFRHDARDDVGIAAHAEAVHELDGAFRPGGRARTRRGEQGGARTAGEKRSPRQGQLHFFVSS
jgi:hypothetical protein